jgi:hypothetical protein
MSNWNILVILGLSKLEFTSSIRGFLHISYTRAFFMFFKAWPIIEKMLLHFWKLHVLIYKLIFLCNFCKLILFYALVKVAYLTSWDSFADEYLNIIFNVILFFIIQCINVGEMLLYIYILILLYIYKIYNFLFRSTSVCDTTFCLVLHCWLNWSGIY